MNASYTVATFYKFVALNELSALREKLARTCQNAGIRGTIILASEGINATIAGPSPAVDAFLRLLRDTPGLADLSAHRTSADAIPFQRLKVKIKAEIVTFRCDDADPNEQVGRYVSPEAWNALVDDPQVVVIDTRNQFEVDYGSFANAIDPETKNFSDFPDFVSRHLDPKKHAKVAMFCTGGIRCEKATSHLLSRGFDQVYHLQGGILNYLASVPPERSRWQGDCFVFDERETVNHADYTESPTDDGT